MIVFLKSSYYLLLFVLLQLCGASVLGEDTHSCRGERVSVVGTIIEYRVDGYRDDLVSNDYADIIYDVVKVKLSHPLEYNDIVCLVLVCDDKARNVLKNLNEDVTFELDKNFFYDSFGIRDLIGPLHSWFVFSLKLKSEDKMGCANGARIRE